MSGLADYTPLRRIDEAKRCRFLGATLTDEEVNRYRAELLKGGIPCRHCNGETPARNCSHPQAGPFTRIAGRCTSCSDWLAAP